MDGAVLTYVINKLSDLLEQKVRLIAGAEDEIGSLRDELSLLTIFLGGINDQSDGTTPIVLELMRQLRRVSWKAEDVVDQYILDVARHERKKFVKKVFTSCGMLSSKGRLAAQAKEIKLTVDGILKKKETYGIRLDYVTPSDRSVQQNSENALDRRRNIEEEDVVGFDQQTCEVMEMLMLKGGVEAEELRVVSIIGMGGLGKSTLARKIFNHEEIKVQFKTKVWVIVSEHTEVKHVLKNILQYLKVDIKKDDGDYLKGKLKEELDGRKYLIVLDDLWILMQWEELKSYFLTDQKNGSRILVTSRIENVANVASTASTTYHLNPLGDADSWSLFCKKALKGEKCPLNLEAIGKGIVSKCKGLPLAIIVLGSLLSAAEAKPSFNYWSKILGDTRWHPDSDNDCSKILGLSYRNLPPHLRLCFLYVGAFPEDFEILAKDLCLLWVAEGFVKGRSTELEEDVAEEYLTNLADRNLIMISKRRSNGRIKSCRIHDLLRDFCTKEAERCNLFKVNINKVSQNVNEGIRRLTIQNSDHTAPSRLPLYKGLRTLLDFVNDSSKLRSACDNLSVIRVLHLHVNGNDDRASISIKNLILLRYLKVDRFHWVNLSDYVMIQYISKLSNLQVLNLSISRTTNLPLGIWKLKLLRHIHVRRHATMPDAPSSDDSLPHLQTLSCIIYEEHTSKMLSSERFPNLRKLSVHHCCANQLWAVSLQSLPKPQHLLALKFRFEHKSAFPRLFPGPLNVDALPSTLIKIHMNNIALTSNHWRLLGELKNLQVLKLSGSRNDNICESKRFMEQPLVFEAEAFPQLIHLKLMTDHPALELRNGALRSLQYFIINCGWGGFWDLKLSALLKQLWLLTTLRQVKVIEASRDMLNYIQNLDDVKRSKVTICHVY